MYESEEAARKVTLTGWQSRDGHFYGQNEHIARYAGCTHLLCNCGAEMTKGYTICKDCRQKKRDETYQAKPFKQWNGEPLTVFDTDQYFFHESELLDYCEEHECKPDELQLVICDPQYAWEVNPDELYSDILPEDNYVGDMDPELADAFETLNVLIRQRKNPLSWREGKYRTSYAAKAKAA